MKLNLGAGDWRPDGWTSVDLAGADVVCDLRQPHWPFEPQSVDAMLASHVLEHFTREEGANFLSWCWSYMKPGGVLYIAVPDLDKFIDCHVSGDFSPLQGYRWTDLNHFMGGGPHEPRPEQRHKYMYTFPSLAHALYEGDWQVRRGWYIEGLHNPRYDAISLYVEATAI
jgi:predicted SAM-dependent methyltransferase